ncbi:MAG: glycosyltransferase [Planctomycetota bacterium]|nr:glycosyltransferase [Planctomycetota bacterium]
MGRDAQPTEPTELLWLSAVTWRFPLVGRTRMITEAWLQSGQPTTFVQPPYLRSGLDRLKRAVVPHAEPHVITPWPAYPVSWWKHLSENRLRRAVQRRAASLRRQLERKLDISQTVALVVSPVWNEWLDALPFRSVIYDCIDHVDVHAPRPDLRPLYRRWEDELVQRASAAVVSSGHLEQSILAKRSDIPTTLIRNGVDSEWFRSSAKRLGRPADLPPNDKRPLVGFVGALYEWLDTKLIQQVAAAMPEFDFVFVGPQDGRLNFPRAPNIHALGLRPYEQVPAYIAAFDVCWLPFRQGLVATAANPVKLYEYLSLGKPVVATPVADIDSFEGLLFVGTTVEELASLLKKSVVEKPDGHSPRMEFADRNSWQSRAQAVAKFSRDTA